MKSTFIFSIMLMISSTSTHTHTHGDIVIMHSHAHTCKQKYHALSLIIIAKNTSGFFRVVKSQTPPLPVPVPPLLHKRKPGGLAGIPLGVVPNIWYRTANV